MLSLWTILKLIFRLGKQLQISLDNLENKSANLGEVTEENAILVKKIVTTQICHFCF